MKMKTKHKLKLLSILPKGFQEYEDLRKSLFLEAMGNTTEIQKPEIETKSESITERFNEGDYAEIIWDSFGHGYNTGEIVRILGGSEFNPINYKCVNKRNKVRYSSNKDIKKIPIQKENPKEFKVGDKVRVIRNLGTILEIDTILTLNRVEPLDDWYLGMDKDGIGYQLRSLNIEHI